MILKEYRTKIQGTTITDKTLLEIIANCIDILKDLGYYYDYEGNINFETKPVTSYIALCSYPKSPVDKATVTISSYEVENAEERKDEIASSILHELIHYIDFKKSVENGDIWYDNMRRYYCCASKDKQLGHKGRWKQIANKVSSYTGLNIERCGEPSQAFTNAQKSKGERRASDNYNVKCNSCGETWTYGKKNNIVKIAIGETQGKFKCPYCGDRNFSINKTSGETGEIIQEYPDYTY